MLRQLRSSFLPQQVAGVSPSNKSEMGGESSHREAPPESLQNTQPDASSKNTEAAHTPSKTPVLTGRPKNRPGLKTQGSPSLALSWDELEKKARQNQITSKPAAVEKYRKARNNGAKDRRFKKGSVIDDAG